ncbi:GrpB family protein [Candidatus Pacearchaeota archaeon]|nr:GrpB family protein [Candidatus Pacearchaeota archaeon]
MEGDEIKFVFNKYNKKFKELYKREKRKLKKILPGTAKTEHIGSSSVDGLSGKGIIDIIVSVPKKEFVKTRKNLEKNGWWFRPKAKPQRDRRFLEKRYKYRKLIRIVHLHLTYHNSFVWKRFISLRDYLKKNKAACKEYEKVKKRAVAYAKGEGKDYRAYKNKFMKKIEKEALKEFNKK